MFFCVLNVLKASEIAGSVKTYIKYMGGGGSKEKIKIKSSKCYKYSACPENNFSIWSPLV